MTTKRKRFLSAVVVGMLWAAGMTAVAPPAVAASAQVERWAGPDRYATSATISARTFSGTAPVVFVASGLLFPDALSAAPAADRLGGPILLTAPDALPAVIEAEILRLKPARVVILGGEPSVGPGVEARLAEVTGLGIERWDGLDRYATSARISAETFPGTAPVAFIASGRNFPDALSAASAAKSLGGPILLSEPGSLPPVIEEELTRLAPGRVIILGGDPSVSSDVQARIAAVTGASVERWAGGDRYATSATITARTFTGTAPVVFIASGQNFPDALSAAPAAARLGGPILLAPPWGLPANIIAELYRLKPARIVLLGDTPSVSAGVADLVTFIGSDVPEATGGRLTRATEVRAGTCLASGDGSHRLCVGVDGRFGVYRGSTALWTSGTNDSSVRALRIRSDGNAVLYGRDARIIWESSTAGTSASDLVVQNDGDLMLVSSGGAISWSSMSSATAPRWRLPYASGASWSAGAPHANSGNTAGARGSIDFGPRSGEDRRVLAIADGTVYRIQCGSGSYLGINHANGWQSTYYHLVNYQDQLVGQFVTAGTYLGDVGRTVPCGGGATFDHVHLTIRRAGVPVSVEGVRFSGYAVRSSGRDYWGFWTNAAEARVLTAPGGAACCLTAP